MYSEFTQVLLNLMSLVVSSLAGVATVYLAIQISYIRRIYLREAQATKMERTLQAVQLPPSVTKTMDEVVHLHAKGKLNLEVDSSLVASIREALDCLETLATGILADVYDENIAYSRLGDSFIRFYDISRRFIYESRSNYSSASLYVQLDQLERRWVSRERYSNKA